MEPVRDPRRVPGTDVLSRSTAVLIFLLSGLGTRSLVHAAETSIEYEVKAAFLLNFTKFIEWPDNAFADSQSPIAICILGKDPFGRALDEIVQGEAVNARKVTVRRISEAPTPRTCQVVYVGRLEKDAKTVSSIKGGVLTVGEGDGFLRDGGMIAFVLENRRVRFDINQSAAESADLKLSSKLLSVARSVEKPLTGTPHG